jgi:hypothetical protein
MVRRVALLLCLAATVGLACDCIVVPAREARRHSDVVFRGTILRVRDSGTGYKVVVFHVNRVWKGQVLETFEMGHLGAASCDGFSSLNVGSEWIVYGHRYWPDSDYFPLACNTDLVERAKDIQKLGPGRKPTAK